MRSYLEIHVSKAYVNGHSGDTVLRDGYGYLIGHSFEELR